MLLFTLNQSYHKWTQAPISWDHYKDILIYGRCLGHLAGVYGMAQLKMEFIPDSILKKVLIAPYRLAAGDNLVNYFLSIIRTGSIIN